MKMSTRSVVAYRDDKGKLRGTYVHYDGYPDNMKPSLKSRLNDEGYDSLVNWIEAGIQGQGYSTVDDNAPYNDGTDPWLKDVKDEDYGYIVYPSGRVRVVDNY